MQSGLERRHQYSSGKRNVELDLSASVINQTFAAREPIW
jgi:hypothetical protein